MERKTMRKIKDARKKRNLKNVLVIAMLGVAISARYWVGIVNCLNTTVYAFSYKYGFISRAFMGTVLRVMNVILNLFVPYDLLTYPGIRRFSMLLNTMFIIMLLVFFYMCLNSAEEYMEHHLMVLMFVFSIFAFPEYLTEENFGRSDICMAMVTLLGCYLLIKEKWEYLIIPLSGLAVCIHQGYVLMFFNVLLVVSWCKIFDHEGKKRKKYITIFAGSLVVASVLFLYLNFFSHQNGAKFYDEIYDIASLLAHDGVVHTNLMMHEILGESPFVNEWAEHVHNFQEFPILVLLMLPYLAIAFRFFKNTIKDAEGIYKLKYLAVAVGSATILPDLIVKIDYGRWMFSIVFYYFVTILVLLALKDEIIVRNFNMEVSRMKQKPVLAVALLIYPVLFTPFKDVFICDLTNQITNYLVEFVGRLVG